MSTSPAETRRLAASCLELLLLFCAVGVVQCSGAEPDSGESARRPNVLLIAVDDLNDWVGPLGNTAVHTPNLDRLAERGVVFTNAHAAAPVCNPSRVAVLSGLRPSRTKVYENGDLMRALIPDVVTLPQYFRQHGYTAYGSGKVFHDPPPHNEDEASFDEYYWWNDAGPRGVFHLGRWRSPYSVPPDPEPAGRPTRKITPITKRNFDWAAVDRPESDWPDHKVAAYAADVLSRRHSRPFFLAVGIFRPHVPWFNPKAYVDQYPLEEIQVPVVPDDDLEDLGEWARLRARDSASRHDKLVEFGEWNLAVRAYQASITFSDSMVGRVLDALDSSAFKENTIVVVWSDHGYHLGEKHHWHKRTLWERSTRVPLIIHVPDHPSAGRKSSRAVNLIDLYPTLLDLCGLPARPRGDLDGASLVPLLEKPERDWNRASITTYLEGNHALRNDRWRYIRYATGDEELYDHSRDPHEWQNLAYEKDYQQIKADLSRQLDEELN